MEETALAFVQHSGNAAAMARFTCTRRRFATGSIACASSATS